MGNNIYPVPFDDARRAGLEEDRDLNCGEILDGTVSIEEMGKRIVDCMLQTASSAPSTSELLGLGNNEFVPWQIGVMS